MNLSNHLREIIKNLFNKILNNENLSSLLTAITMVIFWILLAYLVTKITKKIIFKADHFKNKIEAVETKQQITVKRLITNIIRVFFIFWIVIMILKELGLDIVPLLAGAGILAFAIGFGAQELIKDLISGLFLILEKTIRIDDYVEINNYKGTVIDIGLRRIKLINWKGEVMTINNGDIKSVTNMSINPSFAVIEFSLEQKYALNILESEVFKNFLIGFKDKEENVIEMPEAALIISLDKEVKVTVNIKTKVRKHVSIERSFRLELIKLFKENNWQLDMAIKVKDVNNEI